MSWENKIVVRRLYEEIWNKRKLELVDEVLVTVELDVVDEVNPTLGGDNRL